MAARSQVPRKPPLRAASSFAYRSATAAVPPPRKPKPAPLLSLPPLSPPPLALTSPNRPLSPAYAGAISPYSLDGDWHKEDEQRRIARGVMHGLRALQIGRAHV